MEYTQWELKSLSSGIPDSLNPCCNGIYSMSAYGWSHDHHKKRLNPCCNGIYSMRLTSNL